MKEYYSFKIPEPCHEDWDQMTPSAKGRFCSSCSTTVVDFTDKTPQEISDYMKLQNSKRVCGRMKQHRQDKIIIKIPLSALNKKTTFYQSFTCALLLVMGTTLISCNNSNGNKQKIDAVEVIDQEDDYSEDIVPIMGMLRPPPVSPVENEEVPIVQGIMITNDDLNEVPFAIVDKVPKYKDTPEQLSEKELKSYFTKRLTQEIRKNFNTKVIDSTLKDRHKIAVQFKIDTTGTVVDIKAKARYKELEKETIRVLNMLPQFIPGEHSDEKTTVIYLLPIIFENK